MRRKNTDITVCLQFAYFVLFARFWSPSREDRALVLFDSLYFVFWFILFVFYRHVFYFFRFVYYNFFNVERHFRSAHQVPF